MSAALFPPEGASARLHRLPAGVGRPACWAVVVAIPPVEAVPENLQRPGEVSALAFACLADALARKARISGGAP